MTPKRAAISALTAVLIVIVAMVGAVQAGTKDTTKSKSCAVKPVKPATHSGSRVKVVCKRPGPAGYVTTTVTATATATVTKTVTAMATATVTVTASSSPTASATSTPSATATPTATPTPSPPATPSPTATSTPPSDGNVCTADKAFVNYAGERYDWTDWSAGSISGESDSPIDYYADAGLWNSGSPYNVTQHSVFCDHDSWYAIVTDNDAQHDGAVKNYPNTHLDYHSWATGTEPSLTAYPALHSRFAHDTEANAGSYNWSYDIWLNGVGWDGASTEVMIWTDYKNRVPWPISVAKSLTVDGRQWNLWREGTAHGFQFVPADGQPITSGTFDLRAFFDVLIARGFITPTATLGQVDYGVETVSTNNVPKRFGVTDFSVWPLPPDYYH